VNIGDVDTTTYDILTKNRNKKNETWFFSVVDVVHALIQQLDY